MSETWYYKGLQFACTQCGHCCTGEPGTVKISSNEIEKLARAFELKVSEFRAIYVTTLRNGAFTLRERSNGDCFLFKKNVGCTAYALRPKQCQTWPFWQQNLASKKDWQNAASECPGMNQGEFFASDVVLNTSLNDGTVSGGKNLKNFKN